MKKTDNLFAKYYRMLREQGEDPSQVDPNASPQPDVSGDPNAAQDASTAPTEPPVSETPITSNEEDMLITKIINAALFSPSAEELKELENLRLIIQANAHKNIADQMILRICQIIGSPIIPDNKQPKEGEVLPLTNEKKEMLLLNLLDAAIYHPSNPEANTLMKLKEVMDTGKFENSNEEVLSSVLNFIKPSTDEGELRHSMDNLDK
jgi:hypothetical protein